MARGKENNGGNGTEVSKHRPLDPSAATSTNATAPAKSHYTVLDGLRGVASLMVIVYHLCEANGHGDRFTQPINHGYLAVDFFFLLSGFVIAYAYDNRWGTMTQWNFYKRRLIRLEPMVIAGGVVGAVLFYIPKGPTFPLIAHTQWWQVILVMLVGFTLIPLPASMDIRGWHEMFPLNGPQWSLFYEYAANILYAIGLRKLSNRLLGVFVALAGLFLLHLAVLSPHGDVIGGWSVTSKQLHIGFARLLYPFFAGILLMRMGKRIEIKHAFAFCSLLLIVALALPRFGGPAHLWMNGLYESLCIILLFPLIVAIGAGEKKVEGASIRIARFFGDLSYPLYVTHYPLIFIYTAWIAKDKPAPLLSAEVGVALAIVAMILAYACLKLYDEPLRRWLSKRFLPSKQKEHGNAEH